MQNLRIFTEVARCRSFSQAAKLLGITQSAASQRVLQLEEKLGVQLIDRSVRPLALTAAGEVFARSSRDILDQYASLERQVTQLGGQVHGTVRVDSIYSAGIDLLSHVKQAFVAEYPRVEVVVAYKRHDLVYDGVTNGECDLGIVSFPERRREIGVLALRDEKMAVVCSPSHPLAELQQVQVGELDGLPMATFDAELPVGRHIRKYLRVHGAAPVISNAFDNIDTIKHALTVTNQFSILPTRTVLREVAAGSLVVIQLTPQLLRPMGIIHPKRNGHGRVFSPAVQAFVDFLLEHAGPKLDIVDEVDARGRKLVGDRV